MFYISTLSSSFCKKQSQLFIIIAMSRFLRIAPAKEAPFIFAAEGNVNLVDAAKLNSNDLLRMTFCKFLELFVRFKFLQLRQFLKDNLLYMSERFVKLICKWALYGAQAMSTKSPGSIAAMSLCVNSFCSGSVRLKCIFSHIVPLFCNPSKLYDKS